jgi:hypothetical protein
VSGALGVVGRTFFRVKNVILCLVGILSLAGCAVTNATGVTFPCTTVPWTPPTQDGEVKWTGPTGSFDIDLQRPAADFSAVLSVAGNGVAGSPQPDPSFFVSVDVTRVNDVDAQIRPDLREVHVSMDAIPPGEATYDLSALNAKACYCGDDHPLAAAYDASAPCANASGELSQRVCEPLVGTLAVKRMKETCPTKDQYSIDGMCAESYDVTLDVPPSAGRFSMHAHAAEDHELDVSGCVPNSGN